MVLFWDEFFDARGIGFFYFQSLVDIIYGQRTIFLRSVPFSVFLLSAESCGRGQGGAEERGQCVVLFLSSCQAFFLVAR